MRVCYLFKVKLFVFEVAKIGKGIVAKFIGLQHMRSGSIKFMYEFGKFDCKTPSIITFDLFAIANSLRKKTHFISNSFFV
jgi:hypothetical protein